MKRITALSPKFWILIILTGGIVYLFSLTSLAPDGVYFTGDSGLRALISQNLASGSLTFDLNPTSPPWIKALWDKGLFPYGPPFVYLLGGKYFITFPYTFSLVTAPFYAAFGYHGLYIVPFLSTVTIWLVFYWLCKKLDFHPIATIIGMFFLIFPTNLTLFGSVYWEHTLSVCLAFAGFACLFPKKGSEAAGVWAITASGILTGLAVWFRPEQIFLVLYLAAISLYSFAKAVYGFQSHKLFDPGKISTFIGKRGWIYLASSTFTLFLYGFSNWLIYKNFFGVHSIQVLEGQTLFDRLATFIDNLHIMTTGDTSFGLFTPVSLFLIGFLFFTFFGKVQVKFERNWAIWYVFFVLFVLGVSILVPPGAGGKQWGPRFLLLLVPVVTLLFTWQIDHLLKLPQGLSQTARQVTFVTIAILAIAGIIQDPIRGRNYILYNYNLVRPATEALLADSEPVIAVTSIHLVQVFQPALGREVNFLIVSNEEQMAWFSAALLEQGKDTFTHICYSFDCKYFKPDDNNIEVEQNGVRYAVKTLDVKDFGKYIIRKVRVSPIH